MGPAPAVAAVRRGVRESLAGLDHGALVLVACSGGPDSLALAAALAFEAHRAGIRGGGVTVDHQLQTGSADRAAEVAATLRFLGLDPVEVATVYSSSDGDGDGGGDKGARSSGPEAAARAARYAALDEAAERLGAAAVLLGHTLDDQAETVLLGLARGSGARSLTGMAAVRGVYRRPLLGLDRATVGAAAEAADLASWDDPHNGDRRFARARVRHDVLPVLESALGPGVTEALARTAVALRNDADALDAVAATAYDEASGAAGRLDVAVLAAMLPAVRTRVLRRAALAAGCPPTDLSAGHVAELDRLVTHWHGQGPLHLPGGVRAARVADTGCGTLALTAAD